MSKDVQYQNAENEKLGYNSRNTSLSKGSISDPYEEEFNKLVNCNKTITKTIT